MYLWYILSIGCQQCMQESLSIPQADKTINLSMKFLAFTSVHT